MGTQLSELHTGYRAYSRQAAARGPVPAQLARLRVRLRAADAGRALRLPLRRGRPCATIYFDEASSVSFQQRRRLRPQDRCGGRRAPGAAPPRASLRGPRVPGVKRVCVFSGFEPGRSTPPTAPPPHRPRPATSPTAASSSSTARAHVALMGVLADAALAARRRSHRRDPAVARRPRDRAPGLGDLRVVDSMHERKAQMAELADALRRAARRRRHARGALRGLHVEPARPARQAARSASTCAATSTASCAFSTMRSTERFVTRESRAMLLVGEDLDALLDGLAGWQAPSQPKWIDRAQS